MLPRGELLHEVDRHCWLVLERGGSACGAPDLQSAVRDCDVEDLGLVVPWVGDCASAMAEYRQVASGNHRAPVSAAAARVVLYSADLGLRMLSSDVREQLESSAARELPSQSEMRLSYAAQQCDRGSINPRIGVVSLSSIADITYRR